MLVGRTMSLVAAGAVVVLLSGCLRSANAGTEYADELSAYLDGHAAVAEHSVQGHNDLPFSGSATTRISLRADLGTTEVVEAAESILAHHVEASARRNDVTFLFAVPDTAVSATTSFYVAWTETWLPTPDTRDQLERLVTLATAYATADPGITEVHAWRSALQVITESDPLVTARAVAAVLDDGDGVGEIVRVSRANRDYVSFDRGDDLDWMDAMAPIIESARDSADVVRARVTSARPQTAPKIELRLHRDTPDSVVDALTTLAITAGVEFDIAKAA